MTLRFEINPPKVIQDTILSHQQLQESISKMKQKIMGISEYCNGIHLTDSVLGIPRVSPITAGALIRNSNQEISLTVSLRVRDRNLTALTQSVCDSLLLGLNGILVLKGDAPPKGPKDSKLVPSEVVKYFNELGFDKKIDFYLSIPSNPSIDKIQKKIDAKPKGFITQVIHSIDEVEKTVDILKPLGFKVIPIVLVPSEKNTKSAEFLQLDWSNYESKTIEFVKQIHDLTGDVLITSPSDFGAAKDLLANITKS